jgi:hypothetical protein
VDLEYPEEKTKWNAGDQTANDFDLNASYPIFELVLILHHGLFYWICAIRKVTSCIYQRLDVFEPHEYIQKV